MNRILASLSAVGLLAVAGTAQCINVATPGTLIGTGDDTFFTTHYALGFAFPMAGSANGTYTNFRVATNGWLLLTNGTTTPTGAPTGSSYGADASLAGNVAGYSPRIAPYWRDMTVTAPGGVYYDNTSNPGVSCKISWKDTRDYNVLPTKSYTAELFVTGEIQFSYSSGMNVVQPSNAWVGLSRGNGQTIPAQSDLSNAPIATAGVGMIFQQFATGTFDLADKTLSFTPDGTGGWNEAILCQGAFHKAYGAGCYTFNQLNDSFHQFLATPALASPALQGNAMQMTPTLNGYTAVWLPGGASGYVAPSGGATNVNATAGDDVNAVLTPSAPLAIPGGTSATINVHSNCIISVGSTPAQAGLSFQPSSALFASATIPAFYSWHDFNETESSTAPVYTSGRIKQEEVSGVLYVTWDNVESYADPDNTQNPSTIQFQLNLATGVVTVMWVTVSADSTETTFPTGIPYLVGYGGVSTVAGPSVNLATALPITTSPNVTLSPLTLSASPAPVYTGGGSTVPVTYTLNNVVDVGGGVGLTLLFFSGTPIPGGVDLGPAGVDIGMPGCSLYIASLDVTLNPTATAPTSTLTISIPQPLSPGLSFYSQALSLFAPNSLPNGQNPFGGILSNGLQSYFNTF